MLKASGPIATEPIAELPPDELIFGCTEIMREVRIRVAKVAPTDVPVLIRGESGTGKEIVAKSIHRQSARAAGPFVKVSCPAIPGTLLESELFGYEAGAFTGADQAKPGRVEAADQGTLFLDEIAELDSTLQVKLLNLIQDRQIRRIGAQEQTPVNVRIICATHRPLEQEIEGGRFREDLFYRINVVSVHLPALRDRKQDIPQLAEYFLRTFAARHRLPERPLSERQLQRLKDYAWPGNVRELANLINSYVVLGPTESAPVDLLAGDGDRLGSVEQEISLRRIARQASREAQRRVILEVLEANHGNRKQTARALHICYRALLYKIKEFGIPPKRVIEVRRRQASGANGRVFAESWAIDPAPLERQARFLPPSS